MSTANPLLPQPEHDPFRAREMYRYLRLCDVSVDVETVEAYYQKIGLLER